MSGRLTIRNLTRTPVELKVVERFQAAQSEANGVNMKNLTDIKGITKSFSGLMSNLTNSSTPSSNEIAEKAESFSRQDVSFGVGPFERRETDVETKAGEIVRLTFEVDGMTYRVDTPTPLDRSTILTPLAPQPRHELTAVYTANTSHLALFSSAKLESWMSRFHDHTPLSALSIPGTHNSPTHYKALPSVRCQSVSLREQLDNGVRFLDIRVQPDSPEDESNEGLILVHSAFPISLTGNKYFRELVNTVNDFLDANPSETVIISVKREGVGKATDQQLSKILWKHYANDGNRWFTENRIPTVGEVRRKIVLVRRFNLDDSLKGEHNGAGVGIDAAGWPDNCADGTTNGGKIRVQDFYEVAETENIEKKVNLSTDHLARAAQTVFTLPRAEDNHDTARDLASKQPFFVNFLSASNFWKAACWPDKIAGKVNPQVVEFLCRRHNACEGGSEAGDGCTGIVVCDWVGHNGDWDLVRCIVGMNARLEHRENP